MRQTQQSVAFPSCLDTNVYLVLATTHFIQLPIELNDSIAYYGALRRQKESARSRHALGAMWGRGLEGGCRLRQVLLVRPKE
jgi:hypothetical protein